LPQKNGSARKSTLGVNGSDAWTLTSRVGGGEVALKEESEN